MTTAFARSARPTGRGARTVAATRTGNAGGASERCTTAERTWPEPTRRHVYVLPDLDRDDRLRRLGRIEDAQQAACHQHVAAPAPSGRHRDRARVADDRAVAVRDDPARIAWAGTVRLPPLVVVSPVTG